MAITSREDAKVLLEMLDSGEITGAEADVAWKALDDFSQQQAAPEPQQRPGRTLQMKVLETLPAAGLEAGKRIWSGFKQVGGNLADMTDALWSGKPYIGPDVRLADGTIIRGDGLETSRARKTTAEEVVRRQVAVNEAAEGGLDPDVFNTMSAVGETGAWAVAPEFAGPKAVTMTGAAAKNAWAGFLGATGQFNAADDKTGDIVLGTTLGPVLGVVPSLAPSVKNYLGQALRNAPANAGAAAEGMARAMPNTPVSLAQRTGIPELIALERAAYDSKLVNFFADQTDKAIADIVAYTRVAGVPGGDLTRRTQGYAAAMNAKLGRLSAQASENWDMGLADVAAMERALIPQPGAPKGPTTYVQGGVPQTQGPVNVGIGGGRLNMPADNFRSQLDAQLAMARNRVEKNVTPEARQRLEAIDALVRKGGKAGLSAQDLSSLLKGLNAMGSSGKAGDAAAAHHLRTALFADIDNLAQSGSGAQSDVAQRLLDVRAEYKRAMAAKDALAENEVYKLLSVDSDLSGAAQRRAAPTASELLDGYGRLSPERQVAARAFMETNAPKLLAQMKDATIQRAVRRARSLDAAPDSRQSLDQLVDNMFDPANGYSLRNAGLFSPEELKRFEDVKDGLRIIATNRPGIRGAGTRILPEDVAINLVVRHAGFMARQATRMLMGSQASAIFTNPAIYENLIRMKQSTTGTASNLLARAALLEALQTEGGEVQ